MKTGKIVMLLLLFAIVLIFAYQNLEEVNVSFINWSTTVPFSLTIFLSFFIGVLAGALVMCCRGDKRRDDNKIKNVTKSDNT